MKITALSLLPLALILSQSQEASAFAPSSRRVQLSQQQRLTMSALQMMAEEDDDEGAEEEPAADVAPPVMEEAGESKAPASDDGGALVAITQESIEFTAGLLGGVVGLVIGGPFLAAVAAAAANLASKQDGNVVGTVSKSGIEFYNILLGFNAQYGVLDKAGKSLGGAVDSLKASEQVDPDAVEKVEQALATTKAKITDANDEYDLVGAGMTALGVVGDLVEKTATVAGDLNEQYDLTSKAKDALDAGMTKAGVADSLEQATSFLDEKKSELEDKLGEVGLSGTGDAAVDGDKD